MNADQLQRERADRWEQLETFTQRLARRGPRNLSPAEVTEFMFLYREASADLARLRVAQEDPAQLQHLNQLVARAHGHIYRRQRTYKRISILNFFMQEFPQTVRRRWRAMLASLLVFLSFSVMGYFSVLDEPAVVADILGGAEHEFRGVKTSEEFLARFQSTPSPVLSSVVTVNNILVAFNAFALGITFGVGTIYVLIVNGAMLGGFAGAFARSGVEGHFWMTVMVHGGVELTAIIIAAGAGLTMGYALWCPGRRTRLRALREDAVDAVKIALGLIPAFILAGAIEGFVTPAENLSAEFKFAIGIGAMLVFWLYLAVGGRASRQPKDAPAEAPTAAPFA
jgi:uncharacterized membrane protein SpoIIM required for sporulation